MKTYDGLFKYMLSPTVVWNCMMDAAEGKLNRPEVQKAIKNFDQTYELVVKCATDPNYRPCEDNVHEIIDGSNNKPRKIEKPKFCPEQILHHMIVEPFKPILTRMIYSEVYGCLPEKVVDLSEGKKLLRKYGPHAAVKRIEKWVRKDGGDKLYICEADIHHAYASVNIPALMAALDRIIDDPEWLRLVGEFLHYNPETKESTDEGLVLGHYTSPWFFNFYLSVLDYRMVLREPREEKKRKSKRTTFHYLRYADNIFMISSNKKYLHAKLKDMKEYLHDTLGMELNSSTQIYRFEHPDLDENKNVIHLKNGKRKMVGRAVNLLGFVLHYDRLGSRKSCLKRMRRKANKVRQKDNPTWHDAYSMCSRMAMIRFCDAKQYANKYIKPGINFKHLKSKIRQHQKMMGPAMEERRRVIHDGLENSEWLTDRPTGGIRYEQQQCGCLPTEKHSSCDGEELHG